MHQITQTNWPSVEDLYPHVGMSRDWPAECVPPATSPAASLPAPAAEQGGRTSLLVEDVLWNVFSFVVFFAPPAGFVACLYMLVTR